MSHSMIWLNTDEIASKIPCTCVDGRTSGMRYSAAGGSFGLMIHLLNKLEQEQNLAISDEQLQRFIRTIGESASPVYLHSDQHAIDLVFAKLGLAPDTKLRDLTESQQRSFIELMTKADYQGCGHIRLMMTHVDQYAVNVSLLQRLLSQFFIAFFDQAAGIYFDILAGQHEEEEVLIIEEQHSDAIEQTALYQEDKHDKNRFFCHRPLKRELIKRLNAGLALAELPSFDSSEVLRLAEEHDRQAETTLGHLAATLPVSKIAL